MLFYAKKKIEKKETLMNDVTHINLMMQNRSCHPFGITSALIHSWNDFEWFIIISRNQVWLQGKLKFELLKHNLGFDSCLRVLFWSKCYHEFNAFLIGLGPTSDKPLNSFHSSWVKEFTWNFSNYLSYTLFLISLFLFFKRNYSIATHN